MKLRVISLAAVCWLTLGCSSDTLACRQAASDQAIAEDVWGAALAEAAAHEESLDSGEIAAAILAEHQAMHEEVLEARIEVIIATTKTASVCG
ncbi:MAG: hypothetical protein OXH86_12725 [Acidimicrobiaceae bacterium]|nr:hypothetical protein [Acidimicrobiaceae bacterium]MDE0321560.1 hypothetical protein [Acidimicrobiaceae bacterium]MDE0498207.1 hypothetical protein [Acidimicrobiaceae bacterium]